MPVYLVQAGASGPVKIGLTSASGYAGRMVKLQVDNAAALCVLRLLEGDARFEAALHARFSHLRIRGEWFTYDASMLGDLGADTWTPPAKIYVPGRQSECWTPERRAAQQQKLKAIYADPIRSPVRLAKLRATLAAKKVGAEAKKAALHMMRAA